MIGEDGYVHLKCAAGHVVGSGIDFGNDDILLVSECFAHLRSQAQIEL